MRSPGQNEGAERGEYLSGRVEVRAAQCTDGERRGGAAGAWACASLSDASLDAFTVYSQQLEPAASEAPQAVRDSLDWLAGVAGQGGVNALPTPVLPNANEAVSYAGSVVRLHACVKSEGEAPCRRSWCVLQVAHDSHSKCCSGDKYIFCRRGVTEMLKRRTQASD